MGHPSQGRSREDLPCYGEMGEHLICVGRHVETGELVDKALRSDPYYLNYQADIGFKHLQLDMRDRGN